jgi:Tetratricopeptide repeat
LLHGAEAALLKAEGRFAESELAFRVALADWQETGMPDGGEVASVLSGLATLYLAQERLKEAADVLDRAIALVNEARDAAPADHLKFLRLRAALERHQGEWRKGRGGFATSDESHARPAGTGLRSAHCAHDGVCRGAPAPTSTTRSQGNREEGCCSSRCFRGERSRGCNRTPPSRRTPKAVRRETRPRKQRTRARQMEIRPQARMPWPSGERTVGWLAPGTENGATGMWQQEPDKTRARLDGKAATGQLDGKRAIRRCANLARMKRV